MSLFLGISGAKRNVCAAICVDGEIRAVREQERLTRIRSIGLGVGTLPMEAVNEVLALSNCRSEDETAYVVAEPDVQLPKALPAVTLDHHAGRGDSDPCADCWSGRGSVLAPAQENGTCDWNCRSGQHIVQRLP